MSSSAALASTAEPAISTVKPTSPSFDFKMPDSRSSSSITRRRTRCSPLSSHLLGLAQFKTVLRGVDRAGDYVETRLYRRDGPRLLAGRRVLRRHIAVFGSHTRNTTPILTATVT